MAYLGGMHYWWPKMTGRMYPEGWAKLSALVIFLGFNLTFFPQFILGYLGMPRRYHVYPEEFQVLQRALHRGRFRAGRGLPDADDLLHLVAALRQGGAAPIRGAPPAWNGRPRRRRRSTISTRRRLSPTTRTITPPSWERRSKLADHAHAETPRPAGAVRYRRSSRRTPPRSGCGSSSSPKSCSSAACSRLHGLPPTGIRTSSRSPVQQPERDHRRRQYRRPAAVSSFTMVLAVRAAQLGQREDDHHVPDPDAALRRRLPGREGLRVEGEVRGASHSRARRPSIWKASRPRSRDTRSCSSRSTSP